MEPALLLFEVLILCEDRVERERMAEAFRRDPHFRVVVAPSRAAGIPVEPSGRLDLVVARAGARTADVSRLVDAHPFAAVIACRDTGDPILVQADAVVPADEPWLAVIAARWLLDLPSRVAPARRTALRRFMRTS